MITSAKPARWTAPLSFAQEQFWLEEHLVPGSSRYLMPSAIEIHGRLDALILHRALQAVIQRHEALRTAIRSLENGPVQSIESATKLSMPRIDAAELAPESRDQVRSRIELWNRRSLFDLSAAPLFRALLLRTAPGTHVLFTALHHIVADGWSIGILIREVAACYEALAQGREPDLPPVASSYAHYAIAQRERLRGPQLDKLLDFWTERLNGVPPARELWTTPDPIEARTNSSGRVWRQLAPALSARIEELARRRRVTPFSVYLAAMVPLLSRKLGEPDISVGVVTGGRAAIEWEHVIGLFVNVLIHRTRLNDSWSFGEVVDSVHREWMEIEARQDLPFEILVERLNPPRRPDRTPFFDVLFNYGNFPRSHLTAADLRLDQIGAGILESKFPLTVYLQPGEETKLCFAYRTSNFSAAAVNAFADQYEALLDWGVQATPAPLGSFSLVTASARKALPDAAAPLRAPAQTPVTGLLAHAAAAFRERLAFRCGGGDFSYGELSVAAHSIAAQLWNVYNIKPGVPVALCLERGTDLFLHMYGVLLAGGVLVMLDPNIPEPRLHNALMAAGCKLLVIDRAVAEPACQVAGPLPISAGEKFAQSGIEPSAAAYVFFTSGTTGTPKGIRGVHRGLSQFLCWQRDQFEIGPEHRFAQLTSPGFDVVLRDVLVPWISGAALIAPSAAERAAPALLMEWLRRERITALHAVPSLAAQWLATPSAGSNEDLRFAFFAGESLTGSLVRRWRDAFPACRVINLYGPTETTLAKAWYEPPAECHNGVQPVGRPLPNTQLLVLNSGKRLCGVEEPGDIVIRTPFGTLGYLDEEQSRLRFVPNPMNPSPRDIVYFTGDRGRYRPDGNLEILGRTDRQVKVNGVRIELDEVAAELRAILGVDTCEVLLHGSGESAQLAAFVTGSGLNEADLHRQLSRRLPPASMPSRLQVLDRMPLLPNGKVDRLALAAMELGPAVKTRPEASATPIESEIADLWEELLKSRPTPSDHFFLSGGHSMQAVLLIVAINERFHTQLTLRDILERPTVAELAIAVETSGDADTLAAASAAVAIEPLLKLREGTGGIPVVCVHPGSGLAGCYHALSAFLPKEHSIYGLQADWAGDGLDPYRNIESMAQRYIDRLRIARISPSPVLAGWSSGGLIAFEIAVQMARLGQQPRSLILLDARIPAGAAPPESAQDALFLASRFQRISGLTEEELAGIPAHSRIGRVLAALRAARMIPATVTEGSFSRYCEFLFTFAAAKRAYQPSVYSGDVLLIRTTGSEPNSDPAFAGWKPYAPELRTCTVPGTHYEMMRQPAVSEIARRIAEAAGSLA